MVRVPNGDVQCEIVVERGVGWREIELCERGVGYVEFKGIRAEYQPEDERGDGDDYEDCEEYLKYEIEDTTAYATATAGEAVAATASATGPVGGFDGRGD